MSIPEIISVLLLVLVVSVSSNGDATDIKAGERLSEIDRKLKLLNKPAVKSIQSEDGDIIDCVDIYKQPAFDHPALTNHKIQLKPSVDLLSNKVDGVNETSSPALVQTWQKSGNCPKGTVPIRRIRKEDLLRYSSLEQFGRKASEIQNAENIVYAKGNQPAPLKEGVRFPILTNRSAAYLVTVGYNYIGAQGAINVWNPNVDLPDDYTTGEIALQAGPGNNFENIEAGWAVNPKLYGDRTTRLFLHWTKDSYKSTGCFDAICAGFVQTGQLAVGASISPISSPDGQRFYLTVVISRDRDTGNWWVKVNENQVVGYWPGDLFDYLRHSATVVLWGGQVYSPNVKATPHTRTVMGSGSSAQSGGSACSIEQVRIVDYSEKVKYPEWLGTWADEYYCYDAYYYTPPYPAEPVFYFGGSPGQSPQCM